MRHILIVLALSCCAFGQSENEITSLVHDLSARLKSPPDFEQYDMPEFTIEISSNKEINAFAQIAAHKIVLNDALARAFYNAPGELAFVIAHEIGHIHDAGCEARGKQAKLSGTALKRMCEAAADEIGLQYLLAAGYTWWDAAGAMGRMIMAQSSQSSVLGIIMGRFLSDHPVTVDRIHQLATIAQRTCQERPELCGE